MVRRAGEHGRRRCPRCDMVVSVPLRLHACLPPPCSDCKSRTVPRSACPGCGKVVCQTCAEREGEFCCDGEGNEVADG